jgi:hypothetical protein
MVTLIGLSIAISMMHFSCQQKPMSLRSAGKIVVIADTLLWSQVGPDIEKILEKEYITPQLEKVFTLDVHSPKDFRSVIHFQNILLVGTLSDKDQSQDLVDQMLSDELKEKVAQDRSFLFQKPDAWARNQLFILFLAKDVPTFKLQMAKNLERVFQLFDDQVAKAQSAALYRLGEKKEIQAKLMMEHGWSVRVQHDYQVAMDSSHARFVWLRRMGPQREFFVYWQEVRDPSLLSAKWMLATRDSLTSRYFEGDKIHQDSTVKVVNKEVDFQGRFAIQLDGVWENLKYNIGGAFRSYGFYSKSDGRLYLVDYSVFTPGEKKWPYMRQLEAMARTFRVKEKDDQ